MEEGLELMISIFKSMKRWDFIIIFALFIVSFLPLTIFTYYYSAQATGDGEFVAVISVDNEEMERVTLTGHQGSYLINLESVDCDHDSIEVKDEEIRMRISDCPDQVCVITGFISKPGQTIICLHHRVVIEIQAVDGYEGEDDMIISS